MEMKTKLRIGFVSEVAYPFSKGGVETRYFNLIQYLLKCGHEITWFTSKQWAGDKEITIDNLKYVAITECKELYSNSRRSRIQPLKFGIGAFNIYKYFDSLDIIDISQYPFMHFFPLHFLAKLNKKATIVSWYEYWGKEWSSIAPGIVGAAGKLIEYLMAFFASQIIVISNQSQKRLIGAGIKKNKLNYVPNWIGYNEIDEIKPMGTPYDICYFGRLKDHKNVDLLIKAIALVKQKGLKLNAKILGDGPERKMLEELSGELELTETVTFLGRIEKYSDLLAYVKPAKLFINPSTKEGGGSIVTLEANACGIPVMAIKSPLGIDEELIHEGDNGFWVPEISPESLAEKIVAYFSFSEEEIKKCKTNSQMTARNYDINVLGKMVEGIYYNTISKTKRDRIYD